ncbi:EpsG family protein [Faecalimonas sp.]
MPIYWSMLLVTIVIGILCYGTPLKKVIVDGRETGRVRLGFVVAVVAYIVFFIGFRDRVLDSSAYVRSFNELPSNFDELFAYLTILDNGKGFYFLAGIFKIFISKNHYVWFFFLAIISCFFLFKTLYKYSVDFPLSAYLFITMTTFTWLLNGTRQFLVVCILFGFMDWLIEGKKICYMLLTLLLTTIHSSAIFMVIIVFFISLNQIFTKKMFAFAILTVVGTYYSEYVFEFLSEASKTMNYTDTMGMDGGSNIIRLFVTAIPVLITMLNYKNVEKIAPVSIKLAINMSLVGTCFYFAATFTNGILVGRMPIYFTIYNLYLLPWVIRNCFTKDSRKIVWGLCVVSYLTYFYYQMCIAWGGLMYVSEFLKLEFL